MATTTQGFLTAVRDHAADLRSDEDAVRATNAVLAELGRHLTGGAADRLKHAVPEGLAEQLQQTPRQGEGAGADEFFAAVAQREGTEDLTTASGHVQAVFRAVAGAADRETLDSVREQLTAELRTLWADEAQRDTLRTRDTEG